MNFRLIFIVFVIIIGITYGMSKLKIPIKVEPLIRNPSTRSDVLLNLIRKPGELSYDFISNEVECLAKCKDEYKANNLSCSYIRPLHLQITQYQNVSKNNVVKKEYKSICVCNYGC